MYMPIWGNIKNFILKGSDQSSKDLKAKFSSCIVDACELEREKGIKITAKQILEKNPEFYAIDDEFIMDLSLAANQLGKTAVCMKCIEFLGERSSRK